MKRTNRPALSQTGEDVPNQYEQWLRTEEDLAAVTIRNYLSNLHHFVVWCEAIWKQEREEELPFTPKAFTTPTFTNYRTYLQKVLHLRPNSVNRSLISLKWYFARLLAMGQMRYNPAKVVKLVGEESSSPRHLDEQEEQVLVAIVMDRKFPRSSNCYPHAPYRTVCARTLYSDLCAGEARQTQWNHFYAWQVQQISRDTLERTSSCSPFSL